MSLTVTYCEIVTSLHYFIFSHVFVLSWTREVQHRNVVRFIGASTKPPQFCIVTGIVMWLSLSSFYDFHIQRIMTSNFSLLFQYVVIIFHLYLFYFLPLCPKLTNWNNSINGDFCPFMTLNSSTLSWDLMHHINIFKWNTD